MKRALSVGAALLMASIAAAPAPSDPVTLLSLQGKSTAGLRFVPLDGPPRALTAGRPAVVVLFASWCSPCMQEMPRTLAEYARYHERVDFLGIDYTDPPSMARTLVARFKIPFPVESFVPPDAAPHPAERQTVHLPATITASQVRSLEKQLPPDEYQRIADVYAARSTMTPEHFRAYEKWMAVYFESPKELAGRKAASQRPRTVGLPHTFVIDARGVLRYVLEGYTPSLDRVARSLQSLGY